MTLLTSKFCELDMREKVHGVGEITYNWGWKCILMNNSMHTSKE